MQQSPTRDMTRERWMALSFALGSTCFLIGPFPGYADLVGATADAVTFFVGSLLFTTGGALQTWLAAAERHHPGAGRAAWWAATTQSAGTLCFNVSTFRAMQTVLSSPNYDQLVWRPDAVGSAFFLISGSSPTAPPRVTAGSRPVASRDGGSPRSTCSAASSSVSPQSPATLCRPPGR